MGIYPVPFIILMILCLIPAIVTFIYTRNNDFSPKKEGQIIGGGMVGTAFLVFGALFMLSKKK